MRASGNRNISLHGAVAGLPILSAGLGHALWQDQQGEDRPGTDTQAVLACLSRHYPSYCVMQKSALTVALRVSWPAATGVAALSSAKLARIITGWGEPM